MIRFRLLASSIAAAIAAALVAGCSTPASGPDMPQTVQIKLIGFNDFHGHLEPPRTAVSAPGAGTSTVAVPAGGVAYLASAIDALRDRNPNHLVLSAGDMIGASPLVSALFLDEPTIEAFNLIRIDFNAVGNHEFDKGRDELLRMARGGCQKYTLREPCRVNKEFPGANFGYLAANTLREDGSTLFAPTGIKDFHVGAARIRLGIIGLTLKGTPAMVTPGGVIGLRFLDEAATANALVPQLKAQGVDVIVVLIHEGGSSTGGYNDKSCPGLSGDILPILERLDPAVDLVISGHTHRAYICDYGKTNPARPFLLTSAGLYGTLLTDIDISVDSRSRKVVAKSASNVIVQGEPYTSGSGSVVPLSALYPVFPKHPEVGSLVARYALQASGLASRPVGQVSGTISRQRTPSLESALGNLIADAQLAATSAPDKGGAQIAFVNAGAVRADLVPGSGGEVTFGQLFTVQPFGNNLVVKTFTGAQLHALLEQQFSSSGVIPSSLQHSAGFSYAFDLREPAGQRVSAMRLHGTPVSDNGRYRVAMNNFLADGGDKYSVFRQGTEILGGDQDIDALEAYIRARSPVSAPATGRITRLSP